MLYSYSNLWCKQFNLSLQCFSTCLERSQDTLNPSRREISEELQFNIVFSVRSQSSQLCITAGGDVFDQEGRVA